MNDNENDLTKEDIIEYIIKAGQILDEQTEAPYMVIKEDNPCYGIINRFIKRNELRKRIKRRKRRK